MSQDIYNAIEGSEHTVSIIHGNDDDGGDANDGGG